jgi:hypothetical protein
MHAHAHTHTHTISGVHYTTMKFLCITYSLQQTFQTLFFLCYYQNLSVLKNYRVVTTVYKYNYHNSGHYPSSCISFKLQGSETGYCLHLQVEPIELDRTDRTRYVSRHQHHRQTLLVMLMLSGDSD